VSISPLFNYCMTRENACVAITTQEEPETNFFLPALEEEKNASAGVSVTAHAKMRAHVIRWVKQANKNKSMNEADNNPP
jgi:hypothetical protein